MESKQFENPIKLVMDKIGDYFILSDETETEKARFETEEDMVAYIKSFKGNILLLDLYSCSRILLSDGKCVSHNSEWSLHECDDNCVWCDISPNEEGEEYIRRYTIYDVYSERELL